MNATSVLTGLAFVGKGQALRQLIRGAAIKQAAGTVLLRAMQ
jgi:hypothetical protein